MKTAEVCKREVVTARRGTSLSDAARLMREHHVGCIVIVDAEVPPRPVGIVTDRDIVVEVIAEGLDHRTMSVDEIMGEALVTAKADDDALETLKLMRRRGVRRLPIVDDAGALAGIVTLDDLLEIAGGAIHDIVGAITSEQSLEVWRRH